MNLRTSLKTLRLFQLTSNPMSVVWDRLGRARGAYRVELRSGVALELRPGSGDLTAFREIWIDTDYTRLGQTLSRGDVVIDVGANIGAFAVFAAQAVGPEGRVIALEPEELTFAQLERNIALNGLKNVTVRRAAVAGQSGTVTLFSNPVALYHTICQNVDGRDSGEKTQRVPAVTLQELMQEEQIDFCHFLKLDCEGAEHDIIARLPAEASQRIGQITMEIHEVEGADPNQMSSRLESLGFEFKHADNLAYFRNRRLPGVHPC